MVMFEAQTGGWQNIFFKSAKGCKRLQVNAIDCRICRENLEGFGTGIWGNF
jgi:hypothetical protein